MPPNAAGGAWALVADDSAPMRQVGQRLLERLGYECDLAEDGAEALRSFEPSRHEVVLVDVEMPEVDGIETTRRLRQMGVDAAHPWIVVMTGAAWEGVRVRAAEAGANAFLEKPVDLGSLRQALAGLPGRDDTPGPAHPVLDVAAFEELQRLAEGAGPDFLPDLLDTFTRDASVLAAEMEQASASGDWDAVGRAAHALRGTSATLAATELQDLCRRIEQDAAASLRAPELVGLRVALERARSAWAERLGL